MFSKGVLQTEANELEEAKKRSSKARLLPEHVFHPPQSVTRSVAYSIHLFNLILIRVYKRNQEERFRGQI